MSAPLVALHGFGDAPGCLAPFLTRLGVTATTPALLAHDNRVMPTGVGFTDDALVADVLPSVRRCAADAGRSVVLMGHSLGASTAVGVAAAAPDLVRALVLEDPPWQVPDEPHGASEADAAAERDNPHRPWLAGLQATDHAGRLGWLREHNPDWPPAEWEPWAQAKAAVDLALFDAPQRWLRRRWPVVTRSVACDVLLLVGDPTRDAACAIGVAEDLAQRPSWHVEVVSGAGHNIRRERPDEAAALAEPLLRG